MEWIPIEKAPKEGTWVLVFCPDGVGAGFNKRDYDVRDAPPVTVARLASGRWECVETYTEVHDYSGYTGVCSETEGYPITPTHWTPIFTPS